MELLISYVQAEASWSRAGGRGYLQPANHLEDDPLPYRPQPRKKSDAPGSSVAEIQAALQRFDYLSGMPQGWDNDQAKPIAKATLKRAMETAVEIHSHASRDSMLPKPRISPLPDGSVDLTWRGKAAEWELNLNIAPGELIEYFGTDDTSEIGGHFPAGNPPEIVVLWLSLRGRKGHAR